MAVDLFESWGRFPTRHHRGVITPVTTDELQQTVASAPAPLLPRGLGRSYGDSCLNGGGHLIDTSRLNRRNGFDSEAGILRCEAGTTLDAILREFVPRGWFLPVTPGTKFVTVGGAIANDIHGKNHHTAGSFGNHVIGFELLRTDGTTLSCSDSMNADWFRATIGGLGLTGCILWADIRLKPISGPYIDAENIKFGSLDEFAAISKESADAYEYTVAWLDCIATGKRFGRGIFIRGNHSDRPAPDSHKAVHRESTWKTIPFDFPSFALCPASMKAFNTLFYHKQFNRRRAAEVHYDPFFYPLDGIRHWNRMYGRRGFLQWQCAVPFADGYERITAIVTKITRSKMGSFLAVLKEFGDVAPVGLLSFPMPGITLALDFANVGDRLVRLLDTLDSIVVEAGGRIYPAKDARMSQQTFHAGFPGVPEFARYVDPRISSSFYRRVVAEHSDCKAPVVVESC